LVMCCVLRPTILVGCVGFGFVSGETVAFPGRWPRIASRSQAP